MAKLIKTIEDTDYTIEIWQNKRQRWMCFGNANVQSAMDLRQPHRLVLAYMAPMLGALHFLPTVKHCCLLGLGGGSIVRFLQHYYAQTHITALEINPQIITIAQTFFKLPETSEHFSLICADATHYIQQQREQYDLILVDLYNADDLPSALSTGQFYQDCKARLATQGILVCNLLCHSQQELKQIIQLIRDVFDHRTLCIDVKHHSNIVVYAFNDKSYSKMIDRFAASKLITSVTLDMEFGVIAHGIKEV